MGSRTVWRRVQDDPMDQLAWADFRNYYLTAIYNWALRRVRTRDKAELVTENVFQRLWRRVRFGKARRVKPDQNGSYRRYIWTVVRNEAEDFLENEQRQGGRNLSSDEATALTTGLDALESEIRLFADIEPELELWKSRYESAVRALKASPHFNSTSFQVFLLVYHQQLTGDHIDSHPDFNDLRGGKPWVRGMATKHARRIRDRLIPLMGLPEPVASPGAKKPDRSQLIVQLMALKYGDPS